MATQEKGPKIRYEELNPRLWPAIVTLFGENGACGGCWCQWWRVERGGRLWEQTKGEPARRRMNRLVTSGRALGILAFDGQTPVGWCSFGSRRDFPRLETVKAYRRDDIADVWCVNCFFIARGHRGRGIARGLLRAALKAMRRRRVKTVEAYPVTASRDGKRLAPAFAWTGPLGIFEELGFREIQRLAPTKPLVRLDLEKR
ncbi:MAG: GNAT family N-acetyltransferase [Deltaproteobacteria bacterium]|nr:GNAT family N-acetyltransferase [Deltaproteobacteria bacterium]